MPRAIVSIEYIHCHYQVEYIGPSHIRPPLGNGKPGLIGGVASREGYIRYNYTWLVL